MSVALQQLPERLAARTPRALEAARRASVAVVLRESAELEVMLIRRTERPGDPWSGHIAFPGGRLEPTDPTTLDAAIRETREEVALDLNLHARFVGQLDDQVAYARGARLDLVISPFVFLVQNRIDLELSDEVAEILWAPVAPMMRGHVNTTHEHEIDGVKLFLPAFRVGTHVVWGLTHRMLEDLFTVVAT